MVNRVDGVILGVGIVVLVASVIGVILYDEQSPQEYTLSWSQSEAMEIDEQTDSGGPGDYEFATNVSRENLARAEFVVEVTASGAQVQDDSVDVEVLTPEGDTDSCSFSIPSGQTTASGSCPVEFDLNERPEMATASGVNTTAAEEEALGQASMTDGMGEWTTTVSIDGGNELQDPDYELTLTSTVYTWQVTASQQGPGTRAG